MKSLVIAEKPSVARDIARVLHCTQKGNGTLEGKDYVVTWALGHLVTLADPEEYDKKYMKWEISTLPMMPDRMKLVVIRQTGKQYNAVKTQLYRKDINDIIIATDAGREGELVARWILDKADCHKPIRRLWISSVTDKAIKEGFGNLKNGHEYDNLYRAAVARAEADWLVGMNGTRALTCKYNAQLSCGRVQTPTLGMVCERYWENRRFTPEAFWQLHIAVNGNDNDGTVKLSSSGKWKEKEPATALYNKVKEAGTATVTKVERKEKTEETPLLFDHDHTPERGQRQAWLHGGADAWNRTEALREETRHLSENGKPLHSRRCVLRNTQTACLHRCDARMERQGAGESAAGTPQRGRQQSDRPPRPARHGREAAIPLQRGQHRLSDDSRTHDRGFLGEVCQGHHYRYSGVCRSGVMVKGSVIRQAGWRAVHGEEDKEEISIPDWQEGDTLTLKGCSITEGKTKPKPLHTEATLLSAMETAGKEVEDDALRQALKDCGIGTPATRAAIIETLFKRGYMERCKKSLVPTEKGLALYSVVKTMRIADVALTGEWEKELARIERGELPADTFRKEIETYTREITSELLSCDKLFAHKDSGCKCPKCGTGTMQFYGKVVRCDNAECGLPVFRLKANRTLSDEEIKDLLTEGHTKLLKGFKSKQGKSFRCHRCL